MNRHWENLMIVSLLTLGIQEALQGGQDPPDSGGQEAGDIMGASALTQGMACLILSEKINKVQKSVYSI